MKEKKSRGSAERISPGQACGFYEYLRAAEWLQEPEEGLHAAKLEDNTNDSGCGDKNHRMKPLGLFADSGKIVKHCQKDQVGNAHQIQDIPGRRISVLWNMISANTENPAAAMRPVDAGRRP